MSCFASKLIQDSVIVNVECQ